MKMKKLLSVLLALAMILCACNVLVLAEGETIVVGQGDDLQSIIDSMENGSTLVLGEDIDLSVTYVAQIGTKKYETLAAAFAAVQEGETIELLAGTISEGTIKMPATLKNVTIKGADDAVIKDTTISASDGNSYSYVGLTFDGIVFDNSRLLFTGWRNGDEIIEDLTVTNCTFKNLNDDTNTACVHINKDVSEPVNGFIFTNNVIDGATGGSKSGIYSANTGNVTITGNTFNNIVFRPALVQLADCDGIADNVVIANNKISNTTRLQVYGSETDNGDGTWTPSGTDTLEIAINENIFENISGYYICTWGISGDTDISENYYDTTDLGGKIYWNNEKPADEAGLAEIGVYPIYTELNDDGTIDTDSAYNPVQNNYVAKIGDVEYETLAEAVAAAVDGDTVQLSAGTFEPIDFGGKDINLIGTVADDGTLLTVFEGGNPALTMHNVNGTVKDIKIIDAFRGVYAEPAGNVTFDNVDMFNCTYGLHLIAYSNDVVWNVQNCEMDLTWANSLGKYNCDGATINIKNNVFKGTNPYYSDYGVLSVNSFSNKITVEDNVFGENTKIYFEYEDTAGSVVIGANYYADGYENAFADDSYKTKIDTYYEDEAMTKLAVALPTATVNVLDADSLGLTFARQFIADDVSDTVLAKYGDWFADFVISFNKDVTFNANGGADGYLSGQYDAWSENWVNVPFEDVTVKANEPLKIMEYAAELMGQSGLKLTYNDVYNFVKNFSCGIYFTPEYLAANPDLKVDLSLSMFDPADETVAYAIGQSMEFVAPTVVAKVDKVGYATLQEAIDAANGKTVTVLKDIELTEGVTVAKGTDVTIDLNGKTVSYPVSKATTTWAIRNLGKLTIKDSATGGTITTLATNPDDSSIPSYANNTIRNEGELILESGTVKNETNSGACFAIDNYSTNSSVTINGGNVTAVRCAIRLFANSNTATNSLVINNGEITGKRAVWVHLPSNADNVRLASVTVNGGTLTSTAPADDMAIYVYSYGDSYAGTEITITDGVFNGYIGLGGGNDKGGSGAETLNITGGTFNYEVFTYNENAENINISGGTYKVKPADEYLADGYEATANEDGMYGIVEAEKYESGIYFVKGYVPNGEIEGEYPYAILFTAGIDSLNYKTAGFRVTIANKTQDFYIDGRVWTKLTVTLKDQEEPVVLTPNQYNDNAKYIMYYILTFDDDTLAEIGNEDVVVSAFVVTDDGEHLFTNEGNIGTVNS